MIDLFEIPVLPDLERPLRRSRGGEFHGLALVASLEVKLEMLAPHIAHRGESEIGEKQFSD